MMREKHIEVAVKYPYYTLNTLNKNTQRIWIIFHGYGMLSRFFIKKFNVLDPDKNFILCPQGLSKFYLDGFSGRVGATWMTKEDRLTEIENQKRYLEEVINMEIKEQKGKELIFLGFSQGVATACRFLAYTDVPFNQLILWAGTFPEDLPPERTKHWPPKAKITYVTGLNDPFLKPEMIENQHTLVKNATGKEAQQIEFDGKHEIDTDTLLKL